MRKFGVKLWSKDFVKNKEFARQSINAVKDGHFDYVELFALPNSFEELHNSIYDELKELNVIIHAPHSCFNVDTGNKELFAQNQEKIKSSLQFADLLKSEIIILHPGFNAGQKFIDESIRQFKLFNDARITVENMPSYCSSTNKTLHGSSPMQIKQFIDETGCKFCLDFSHAICAANTHKRNTYNDLAEYQKLNPCMYHMCDGEWNSDADEHRHYGHGDYPLDVLLNHYTNPKTYITMETGMSLPTTISPWINDIMYLKKLQKAD